MTDVAKKREHLSIGEVLALLQGDFPDLTITKIRFLESQGLIDPERTPSGYRKFYKFDIERLRWVLRQQRENFLPLKVIKDRLDDADGKQVEADPEEQPQLSLQAANATDDPPPVWMEDHARVTAQKAVTPDPTASGEGSDQTPPASADVVQTPPTAAPTEDPKSGVTPRPVPPTAVVVSASTSTTSPPTETVAPSPPPPVPPPAPRIDPTSSTSDPRPASVSVPAIVPKEPPMVASPDQERTTPPAVAPTGRSEDLGATAVSMTFEELARAAGLSRKQLEDLESYGLVVAEQVAEEAIYGDTALLVARHAATLFSAGLEARHLRAFKVAADREAGLYEQLVLPLVKQRNPQSSRQAAELLRKLAKSGSAIHAAILRESLRPYLDR